MKKKIPTLFLVVFAVGLIPQKASAAYIDPNTGGMLFQLLAAAFGILSGLVLIFSSRIKSAVYRVLRNIRKTQPDSTPVSHLETDED